MVWRKINAQDREYGKAYKKKVMEKKKTRCASATLSKEKK